MNIYILIIIIIIIHLSKILKYNKHIDLCLDNNNIVLNNNNINNNLSFYIDIIKMPGGYSVNIKISFLSLYIYLCIE